MNTISALVAAYWQYHEHLTQEDKDWLDEVIFEAQKDYGEDAVNRELNRLDAERRKRNEALTAH